MFWRVGALLGLLFVRLFFRVCWFAVSFFVCLLLALLFFELLFSWRLGLFELVLCLVLDCWRAVGLGLSLFFAWFWIAGGRLVCSGAVACFLCWRLVLVLEGWCFVRFAVC